MNGQPRFDPEFLRFLECFNGELFWESHEVLEGAWRRNRSPFYRGLIIFASAFVHVQRANPAGVAKQMAKVRANLAPYRPYHLGLDVDDILATAERWTRLAHAARAQGGSRAFEHAPPFPRLTLDPARVRGDEAELLPPDPQPPCEGAGGGSHRRPGSS